LVAGGGPHLVCRRFQSWGATRGSRGRRPRLRGIPRRPRRLAEAV